MINIYDDFIDKELLKSALSYLTEGAFVEQGAGMGFFTKPSPKPFTDYVLSKIASLEGKGVSSILSLFREATDTIDTDWRIHSYLKIQGVQPDRAMVIYLSCRELETLHGTAFWEHEIYGKELPADFSNEANNSLLESDSENLDMWRLNSVVGFQINRAVTYPASYFHSKYPNVSWKKGRRVFVMFYKYD